MPSSYWVETLGCPKNQVDSDKLAGLLRAEGYQPAEAPEGADLVVVNTCAFIEAARQESIDTVLALAESRRTGARLVVTGCMAERYGDELAAALPEVDQVAGFGVPVTLSSGPRAVSARTPRGAARAQPDTTAPGLATPVPLKVKPTKAAIAAPAGGFDLLELPRPKADAPWAYVKIAEGCDRQCGFCAIPTFRGKQRSRTAAQVLSEVRELAAEEIVLVAQDLASWGRDRTRPSGSTVEDSGQFVPFVELVEAVAAEVGRVRLLYLYPSELSQRLIDVIAATGCPYYDLSLQHVSRPLLKRMRRFGHGGLFAERIRTIRRHNPEAALRSSFIIGYPGETEDDHDQLLRFLEEVQLDWAGFFPYSREDGTYAAGLPDQVPASLVAERLAEVSELQDAITAKSRSALVGTTTRVLVDAPGVARSHREAPEIDGIVRVPATLAPGTWHDVEIVESEGPDLVAVAPGPKDGR
jgi:ribosomal protein S12 methylthiotransferase